MVGHCGNALEKANEMVSYYADFLPDEYFLENTNISDKNSKFNNLLEDDIVV